MGVCCAEKPICVCVCAVQENLTTLASVCRSCCWMLHLATQLAWPSLQQPTVLFTAKLWTESNTALCCADHVGGAHVRKHWHRPGLHCRCRRLQASANMPKVHKTIAKTLTSSCAVQTTLVEPPSGNNELELALIAAAHSSSLFSSVASV